jgi:mycoredoxin-dependent peroxiredoxin
MPLEVGTEAPDFTLKDYNNEKVTLSSFRGKQNVLIVFYPLAFSGICQGELCQLRDDFAEFDREDVQVLAVSVDSGYSLKAWAQQQEYKFPLLSDFWPHGAVAQAYGVFNDKAGIANRGTFLVDTAGIIRYAEMNQPGEARDQLAWKNALAALPA